MANQQGPAFINLTEVFAPISYADRFERHRTTKPITLNANTIVSMEEGLTPGTDWYTGQGDYQTTITTASGEKIGVAEGKSQILQRIDAATGAPSKATPKSPNIKRP